MELLFLSQKIEMFNVYFGTEVVSSTRNPTITRVEGSESDHYPKPPTFPCITWRHVIIPMLSGYMKVVTCNIKVVFRLQQLGDRYIGANAPEAYPPREIKQPYMLLVYILSRYCVFAIWPPGSIS